MPDSPPTATNRWPPLLRDRGGWWDPAFDGAFLFASLIASIVLSKSGWLCSASVAAALLFLVLKVCFKAARSEKEDDEDRRRDAEVTAANVRADRAQNDADVYVDEMTTSWLQLIEDRIATPQAQVLKAVATDDPDERKSLATTARARILTLAAADVLGTEGARVRVNLFEIQDDDVFRCTMSPGGRGQQSTREFTSDTETYIATMFGSARFIHNVAQEIPEEADSLSYQTFATVPIGSPDGRIWGVLTADAPNVGELREDFDIPLMQVYAGLIGITFACEQFPRQRKRRSGTVGNEGGKP